MRRLDSQRTNYASIRSFEVNPLRLEGLGFELQATNPQQALYAFDKNSGTSFKSTPQDYLEFEVTQGTKAYILLMNEPPMPLKCKQLDAKGEVVSETAVNSPYSKIELSGRDIAKIRIEGAAEIFEIISVAE